MNNTALDGHKQPCPVVINTPLSVRIATGEVLRVRHITGRTISKLLHANRCDRTILQHVGMCLCTFSPTLALWVCLEGLSTHGVHQLGRCHLLTDVDALELTRRSLNRYCANGYEP